MSDEPLPARRRRPCTILIADDHDDTRFAERLVLEHFGFVVHEASTGLDALALALVSRPRIVLLDIVLPDIDGPQLARMLRADPATCHAAIIAVSAASPFDEGERALRAGCDEFVAKPVAPLHLARIAARYARRRETYDFDPLERQSRLSAL